MIGLCSVQCPLFAMLSAAGSSFCVITLTELVRGEMLRPERLAVGEFHLVLQLQAIALGKWTIYTSVL